MQADEPGAMPLDNDNVLRSQTDRHELPQIFSLIAGDLFYPMPGAAPHSLKVWKRRNLPLSGLEVPNLQSPNWPLRRFSHGF
ncbi:hypothetical protein [Paraburkholderia phytofirmans]|uniref:hypothetical protein n=1 Tax=Paraburkholderia phytofirmans TaxID=261302 RepID=UPI0038B7C1FD